MKHWINSNYKTLIITAFLIPIITVAIVSISHVTQWYGISNPLTWAIYLSVGIEIAAMSALAAISANMGKNVYFPFIIVTLIQFIGNIFFAYEYIDVTNSMFKSWVELVSPLVGFMGVEPTDFIGHKRFLALFAGGLLPVISLSFLHMLVKFTEEDRLKDIKEDEEIHQKEIEEKIKHETSIKAEDIEGLRDLVEDAVRLKLSDDDLAILENALLNPPKPNENLIKAAEKYKQETEPNVDEMLDDDDLYNQKEPEEDEDLEQDLDDEVSNIVPEPIPTPTPTPIIFKSPGISIKEGIVDYVPPITSAKVTNPDDGFVQIYSPNQSQGLHPLFSEKYIRPIVVDEPVKEPVNDPLNAPGLSNEDMWNIMIESGLKNEETPIEEPVEEHEPDEDAEEPLWDYEPGDELEDELQDWDVTVADGLEDEDAEVPFKTSNDEEFDGDPIEDYLPVEEDEPVVGDRYPLEQEPEESEEDKKKKLIQNEDPLEEESTQSLPSEENQDLTIGENDVYLDQENESNDSRNINRKIRSRNVNNTTRRSFR